jgi:hypothetical protein
MNSKIRIRDACESVDMQMLSGIWNEIDYRFDCVESPDHQQGFTDFITVPSLLF